MNYFKHEQAIVGDDVQIGEGTRLWAFTNVQNGAEIGMDCNICDGCFIEKGSKIGNRVTIKNNVAVFDGIEIEDGAFIGANITFINDRLPRSENDGDWTLERTIVKKGATLGAGSTILCGLQIGEHSFVGAGSLVTKNVEPYGLYYGHPAVKRGYVCECGKRLDQHLVCECQKSYKLTNAGLVIDE